MMQNLFINKVKPHLEVFEKMQNNNKETTEKGLRYLKVRAFYILLIVKVRFISAEKYTSTENAHSLGISMYKEDVLEFDIERLFTNLNRELLVAQKKPEQSIYEKPTGVTITEKFTKIPVLEGFHNCSGFQKITSKTFALYCFPSSLHVLQYSSDNSNPSFTTLYKFTNISAENSKYLDMTFDPVERILFLSLLPWPDSIEKTLKGARSRSIMISAFLLDDSTSTGTIPEERIEPRLLGSKKVKMYCSECKVGEAKLMFEPGSNQLIMYGYSREGSVKVVMIRMMGEEITVETEYTSIEEDEGFGYQNRDYPLVFIESFGDIISFKSIKMFSLKNIVMLVTRNIVKEQAINDIEVWELVRVKICTFTDIVGCGISFTIYSELLRSPEESLIYGMLPQPALDGIDATFVYFFFRTRLISIYIFAQFSFVSVADTMEIEQPISKFQSLVCMDYSAKGEIIVVMKSTFASFMMRISPIEKSYNLFREQINAVHLAVFQNENSIGSGSLIGLGVAEEEYSFGGKGIQKLVGYTINNQKIKVDFSGCKLEGPGILHFEGSIYTIGNQRRLVDYKIELIQNLSMILVDQYPFKSIQTFMSSPNISTSLPLSLLFLRGNNLQIHLPSSTPKLESNDTIQNEKFYFSLNDMTFTRIKSLEFRDAFNNSENIYNSKLSQLSDLLTYNQYSLLVYKNHSALLITCKSDPYEGTFICNKINPLNYYIKIQENFTVVDFLVQYVHKLDTYHFMMVTSNGIESVYTYLKITNKNIDAETISRLESAGLSQGSFKVNLNYVDFLCLLTDSKSGETYLAQMIIQLERIDLPPSELVRVPIKIPYPDIPILQFDRPLNHLVCISKNIRSDLIVVIYLKFEQPDADFKSEMYTDSIIYINKTRYKYLDLQDSKVLLYDREKKMLAIKGPSEHPKSLITQNYLISKPIADESDITLSYGFSGGTRFTIVVIKRDVHIYDISDDIKDPLRRLIRISELPQEFYLKEKPIVWVYHHEKRISLSIVLLDMKTFFPLVYSIESSPTAYETEYRNFKPKHKPDTISLVVSNPSISNDTVQRNMTIRQVEYNTEVKARAFNNGKNKLYLKNRLQTYRIHEIVAFDCDIIGMEIIQPREIVARLVRPIEKLEPTDETARKMVPDIGSIAEDTIHFISENYTMTINDKNFKVFQGNKLLVDVTTPFETTSFYSLIGKDDSGVERAIALLIFYKDKMDVFNLAMYSIPLGDPQNYFMQKFDKISESSNMKIRMVSEGYDLKNFGCFYERYLNGRAEVVFQYFTLKRVNMKWNMIYSNKEAYVLRVPYDVYISGIFASENTILAYFHLTNSHESLVARLHFRSDSSLEDIEYQYNTFNDRQVLSRTTLMNCRDQPQELITKCVVYYPHEPTKLVAMTQKFSLDSDLIMTSTVDYEVRIPEGMIVTRLCKGNDIDLVFAEYLGQSHVFVFDIKKRRFIDEIPQGVLPKNPHEALEAVQALGPDHFLLLFHGNKAQDSIYKKNEPRIEFLEESRAFYSDLGYYLKLKGFGGKEVEIPFYVMFDIETPPNYPLLISLILISMIITVLICFLMFRVDGTEKKERKREKSFKGWKDGTVIIARDENSFDIKSIKLYEVDKKDLEAEGSRRKKQKVGKKGYIY